MTDERVQETSSGLPARSATVKDFAGSELFERTFQEGMELVEETAAYLDGTGRKESKLLSRNAALAYAGESMRLTTRLMQIASWLLVQRALAEGEITPGEALRQKSRVRLSPQQAANPAAALETMPERLRDLVALSLRFHARVLHLEALLNDDPPRPIARECPVTAQQRLIGAAFARA